MDNYLTFFPVGNGDMTLIQTSDDLKILVDCNIRKLAEEDTNNEFNCLEYLKNNLPKKNEQLYVDAMFLTHSDHDHCRGASEYFNLCEPENYSTEKIAIHELVVPARLLIDNDLQNDDAKSIRTEAERRLALYDTDKFKMSGNMIQIIGYSDDLKKCIDCIVPAGGDMKLINDKELVDTEICVLRPVKNDTDDEESSVNDATAAFKFTFKKGTDEYTALLGGDMTCDTWKEVIAQNPDLMFDILLAPHHCSWHAISNEDKSNGEIDSQIAAFLEQSRERAHIIVSSKLIRRDCDNPPSYRAKNYYNKYVKEGRFQCTADYPDENQPMPYTLQVTKQGISEYVEYSSHGGNSKYNAYVPKSYGAGD